MLDCFPPKFLMCRNNSKYETPGNRQHRILYTFPTYEYIYLALCVTVISTVWCIKSNWLMGWQHWKERTEGVDVQYGKSFMPNDKSIPNCYKLYQCYTACVGRNCFRKLPVHVSLCKCSYVLCFERIHCFLILWRKYYSMYSWYVTFWTCQIFPTFMPETRNHTQTIVPIPMLA